MKKPCFMHKGKEVFPCGGQVHNSSAHTVKDLARAFEALRSIGANAVEIPVYWEQVEPSEGSYDFSVLEEIFEAVRARGLYFIPLWFGTWKNGTCKYAPEWVKADVPRFWRVSGKDGHLYPVLSPHCLKTQEADGRAFAEMMACLKALDPQKETVIAVQVQNEPGIMNGPERDYAPVAQALFSTALPATLIEALERHPDSPTARFWQARGCGRESWEAAFGDKANQLFTAYHTAVYIQTIAKAGRQRFDCPLYTNAWVEQHRLRLPGVDYPSGSPTGMALDIWKWSAPDLDWISPDNYQQTRAEYNEVCSAYARKDNGLFIPESGLLEWNARFMFEAVARHQAMGMFVFGVESLLAADGTIPPAHQAVSESMQLLSALAGGLPQYRQADMRVVLQEEYAQYQYLELDGYTAIAYFTHCHPVVGRSGTDWNWHGHQNIQYRERQARGDCRGRGIIIQSSHNEILLCGDAFQLVLMPKREGCALGFGPAVDDFHMTRAVSYLAIEEGFFARDGQYVTMRRRNGDEADFGLWVEPSSGVVRARLCK